MTPDNDSAERSDGVRYVIPAYGVEAYTHSVVEQLTNDGVPPSDVIVVDNMGTFETTRSIQLIKPRINLGWLVATNVGMEMAFRDDHCRAVVWLNNDVTLSPGFGSGFGKVFDRSDAWIVGPLYDGPNAAQRKEACPDLETFEPEDVERTAVWLEGTCAAIRRECYQAVGLLDAARFGWRGWGADIDYALRAGQAGGSVVVTESMFLHHVGGGTAKALGASYNTAAFREMSLGMRSRWGADWASRLTVFDRQPKTRLGRLRVRAEEYVGIPQRRWVTQKRLVEGRRILSASAPGQE